MSRIFCAALYSLAAVLSILAAPLGAAPAAPAPTGGADSAAELVLAADRIRFPQEAFQVDVRVKSQGGASAGDERLYRILSKGNSRTIVLTLEPASERGQILLMKDTDLWVFLPKVSQPVRLPLSQKLTGQVANGDLARANFAGDYSAQLLREETIEGRRYNLLELKAARKGVTYPRVLYWTEQANNRPFQAEFYTLSGKKLKSCRYEDFQKVEGNTRPLRLVLKDALKGDEISILSYGNMKRRELDDKIFTKEYMKKLQ